MQGVLQSYRNEQGNLFQSSFTDLLDHGHPLSKLSHKINWSVFEEKMGKYFSEDQGRPSLPVRLMVGLHYLKSMDKESNESGFHLENPFCFEGIWIWYALKKVDYW